MVEAKRGRGQRLLARKMAGKSFWSFSCKDIDGEDVAFEKFRGKVVLVVNVASA